MAPHDPPRPLVRSPLRHGRAAVAVLVALALAGCGIRVETPPPPPPVPGPLEVVRQDAAEDSAELARQAGKAAEETLDEDLYAVLEGIRLTAEEHVESLGGVYSAEEGGVVDPTTSEVEGGDDADDEGADDVAPAPPVTPADLALHLAQAGARARAAADGVDDAGLAQLLAVVGTSRLLAADAVAREAGLDRPDLGGSGLPTVLPVGVGATELAQIVVAEDQAGFAFEVIAARSEPGRVRDRAVESAARHRATSDAWARLAGLDAAGLDPRPVTYALSGQVDSPKTRRALGAELEQALMVSYAALVTLAEPGSRVELSALHTLAAEHARRWGLRPTTLPGLG